MKLRYFEITEALALTSPNKSFRFGAILVRGNNIINKSTNQDEKTHPLKAEMYPNRSYKGLHAEIALFCGFRNYDVKFSDVYVTRLLANNVETLARPCSQCENYMKNMGISRVFYSIAENEYGCLRLK